MSLFSQLEELQWKQLQHDEKYHKDIWLLPVQQRITHMTLHLAKYSAKLTVAAIDNDSEDFKKTLIDCLIITLSSANIFNSRIYDIALSDYEKSLDNIGDLANHIINSEQNSAFDNTLLDFSKKISFHVGKLCKAAESLDHLEPFPFRQNMTECLGMGFRTSLAALYTLTNENIEALFSNRLLPVEKKNIFFNRLGNYESGY